MICFLNALSVCSRSIYGLRSCPLLARKQIARFSVVDSSGAVDGDAGDEEGVESDFFEISEQEADLRLDKVLTNRYNGFSRNYFGELITSKKVTVDGDVLVKKAAKLKEGSKVEVTFTETNDPSVIVPSDIPINIIYEDEHILVLNKDAGMVVHPAPGNWDGTLVNALAFRYKEHFLEGHANEMRPGIVHRLDQGTSGVIIVARTPAATRNLQDQFRFRTVKKNYLAVTCRNPFSRGTVSMRVNQPIGRHSTRRTEMAIVSEENGGRTSSTVFYHIASDTSDMTSLLQVALETGRTHQIRVHLKHLRAPVLGDEVYGYETFNTRVRKHVKRPLLHAFRLEVDHPITGERLLFQAKPPSDVVRVIEESILPDFSSNLNEYLAIESTTEKIIKDG
ncbi:hypothetical protein NDN08_005502 [Rhodosorus marinus]|uniref:Pseudouridine synthase n=1 Tax=Rhodosorus marinus TaxID=101924 RepID=A0AAV8V4H4_9RHOD|nr:hypothetical protein NDN08_005502 [Rhodosorus marinus]